MSVIKNKKLKMIHNFQNFKFLTMLQLLFWKGHKMKFL